MRLFGVQKKYRLAHAVRRGDREAVRDLLEKGADANSLDCEGNCLLQPTLDPFIMTLLLEYGADPNRHPPMAETVLYDALSRYGYIKTVVDLLLQYGANPNLKSPSGDAPIHLAITRRDARLTKQLLKYGADPFLPNFYGQTPIDLARHAEDDDLLHMLLTISMDRRQQNEDVLPSAPPAPEHEHETAAHECGICLGTKETMAAAHCGHVFCRQCWMRTIECTAQCPACRRPVSSPSEVITLYL